MKHRNNHFAVGYWSRIRGTRPVPAQSDIDPRTLKRLLSQVFILEAGPASAESPYRLAGTQLCEQFGQELRGKSFLGQWDEGSRRALATLLAQSLRLSVPVCLTAIGVSADCKMVEIETVLMPIAYNGESANRFLGVMQILGDSAVLAGRTIAFQRLVASTMMHGRDANSETPADFGDGFADSPQSRVPHLRLVVSRGQQADPLRIDSHAFDRLFERSLTPAATA